MPDSYEYDQAILAVETDEAEYVADEPLDIVEQTVKPEWVAVQAVFMRNRRPGSGVPVDFETNVRHETPRTIAEQAVKRAGNPTAAAAVMDFIELGGSEPSLEGLSDRAVRILLQAAHTILEHYEEDPAMAERLRSLSARRNAAMGGLHNTDYGIVTRTPHIPREAWMGRALCQGLGAARFFEVLSKSSSERALQQVDTAAAKSFCRACPVRNDCLEYALSSKVVGEHGVWGGLDAEEREAIKKARKATKPQRSRQKKKVA